MFTFKGTAILLFQVPQTILTKFIFAWGQCCLPHANIQIYYICMRSIIFEWGQTTNGLLQVGLATNRLRCCYLQHYRKYTKQFTLLYSPRAKQFTLLPSGSLLYSPWAPPEGSRVNCFLYFLHCFRTQALTYTYTPVAAWIFISWILLTYIATVALRHFGVHVCWWP